MIRPRHKPRPDAPHDALARQAAFPNPRYADRSGEMIDTSNLPIRKIHPERDEDYKRWLWFKPCAVEGLIDSLTEQVHVCWSPATRVRSGRPLSDPAHTGKAYSGALKRSDRGCIPLCRHAHRQQEDNMDAFDRRFNIDRHEIAERMYAEYRKERG